MSHAPRALLRSLGLLGALAGGLYAASADAAAPSGYSLTYAEEFNGSEVDWKKWDPYWVHWGLRHQAGNGDQSIKAADHERLKGGKTVGELLRQAGLPPMRNYLHEVGGGTLTMRAWPIP